MELIRARLVAQQAQEAYSPPSQHEQQVCTEELQKLKRRRRNRRVKGCNCKKSKCLKLYCECFAKQAFCGDDCNCNDCNNVDNDDFEDARENAIRASLDRNSSAFFRAPVARVVGMARKGCKCKKSMCAKNYCECYQAGMACTDRCRCKECHNEHGVKPARVKRRRQGSGSEAAAEQVLTRLGGLHQPSFQHTEQLTAQHSQSHSHHYHALAQQQHQHSAHHSHGSHISCCSPESSTTNYYTDTSCSPSSPGSNPVSPVVPTPLPKALPSGSSSWLQQQLRAGAPLQQKSALRQGLGGKRAGPSDASPRKAPRLDSSATSRPFSLALPTLAPHASFLVSPSSFLSTSPRGTTPHKGRPFEEEEDVEGTSTFSESLDSPPGTPSPQSAIKRTRIPNISISLARAAEVDSSSPTCTPNTGAAAHALVAQASQFMVTNQRDDPPRILEGSSLVWAT